MLVTGGFTLLLTLLLKLFVVIGKPGLGEYFAVIYVLIHSLGAVCTYKEWVPESFKQYPKDVMQW
jgi:hypothetical protein